MFGWFRLVLLMLWLGSAPAFSASLSLEQVTGGIMTVACPNGGSTVVDGTEIGKVTYLLLRFTNAGGTPIDVSAVGVSDTVGCTVPFNAAQAFTINGAGATSEIELGVRPTASAWSFTMTVGLTGDSVVSYTHSFSQSGIAAGSGSQVELYWEYSGATKHTPGNSFGYAVVNPVVGIPAEVQIRTSNRSAKAHLTITSPGWEPNTIPNNATVAFEGQLPARLGRDDQVISIFRVTPAAAGNFVGGFTCQTDDGPIGVMLAGTAIVSTKLRVFHGTRELASNNSQVAVSGTTVGVQIPLTFTIRNDEVSPITIGAGINPSYTSGCTTTTITPPATSLAAGAETTWVIGVTPTASVWKCVPSVSQTTAPARTVPWTLRHDEAVRSEGSADDSSASNCGVGSGLASLLLILAGIMRFAMRAGVVRLID